MKKIPISTPVASACLCGALSSSPVFAIDVAEVSGEPTSLQAVGDSRKTLRLRDGKEVAQTGTRIDKDTIEVMREDGCSWRRSTADIYGPSLAWNNCSKGKWGSGEATEIKKSGRLWPLKVGNKVSYEYTAVNSMGHRNLSAFRKCEVTGTEMVKAGGKDYPTYRVVCSEHSGSRVYNYAPEVQTTVFMERKRNRGRKSTMEYLKDI